MENFVTSSDSGSRRSSNIERLIEEHAETLTRELLNAAKRASSEEEVRIIGARFIDEFREAAGLTVAARHEYGLAGGRIDSKYGGVIIEYKNPKSPDRISTRLTARGTRTLVEQIKERFEAFQKVEGVERGRLLGVGCDGENIVFVRFRGREYEVEQPQPITPLAMRRVLRALVSLGATGHSFTSDNLVRDFGANSATTQQGIARIYEVVSATKAAKARTFFEQWKILFGEVCGYDVEGNNPKVQQLAVHYGVPGSKPAELLFAIHTYYAIFMKFLAAEIAASFSPLAVTVLRKCISAPSTDALKREMRKLEQGGLWSELGITNFLEGDLFAWYLADWDDRMAEVVRGIVRALDSYDTTTLSVDPTESRDLLKHLYQQLFPKSVRHDLGEYYTPDWLAEHTLDCVGFVGDPSKRILDPACGSGTFLVLVINRMKEWFREHRDSCGFGEPELVTKILTNVVGFDLNPLAVMAARVNFLLAIRDLVKSATAIEIPIYLCDSIMTPSEYGSLFESGRKLRTSVGEFIIPTEVTTNRNSLAKWAEALESCVRDGYSGDEFVERCRTEGIPVNDPEIFVNLYRKLKKLDADGRNGIWARIVKNAFAPLFVGRMDYVVGNPPWINWENLPGVYRDDVKEIWRRYGLFTLSASAARLGGGKKDLSMLFVYVSIDRYVRDGGRLGFVITQSVFKTKGAGEGFRRLRFEDNDRTIWIAPFRVDDLSAIQIFEGATNRTAVMVARRSTKRFEFPVPYIFWRGPSRIGMDETLLSVKAETHRVNMEAFPIQKGKPSSPWLTVPGDLVEVVGNVLGRSPYKAMAGCTTWLNGVFWINVIERITNDLFVIENLHDVGKIKVPKETGPIEAELIYPLLRGRDVRDWAASPSLSILLTQDPAT
ncbi:MAG: N-6 DNA methylase, partial [Candidatus Binatia bacterium]